MLSMWLSVRERLNEEWLNEREKILSYFLNNDLEVHVFIYGIPLRYSLFLEILVFFFLSFLDLYVHSLYFYIHKNAFHISLIWTIACTCEQNETTTKNSHLIYSRIIISFLIPFFASFTSRPVIEKEFQRVNFSFLMDFNHLFTRTLKYDFFLAINLH